MLDLLALIILIAFFIFLAIALIFALIILWVELRLIWGILTGKIDLTKLKRGRGIIE